MATTQLRARRRPRFTRRRAVGGFWSVVTWLLAIILFFPVFWMVITSFKTEGSAYTDPPKIIFHPTLSQFSQVFSSGAGPPFLHSVFVSLVSVVLVLALALPAAYALSIRPIRRWRDSLFFFLSTKMLPYVAAIVPIYIIAEHIGLLDNDWALVILYTGFNLPLAVWMIRSFFLEVPRVAPGIAATALICVIFTWNEFFFAYFLTATKGPTVPIFLVSFLQSEGQYWARLSAAATAACLPVILAGWIAQKQLVRGLSLGALK
jgi:sorbitol/mannitol transport system permease protein